MAWDFFIILLVPDKKAIGSAVIIHLTVKLDFLLPKAATFGLGVAQENWRDPAWDLAQTTLAILMKKQMA